MKPFFAVAAMSIAIVAVSPARAATNIFANATMPTSLGFFAAGKYKLTATGLIDLVGPVGSGFTMRPNGIPDSLVTAPAYPYFNPGGSDIADGNYGPGGPGRKIGSLLGTLTATPSSPADYFSIGYSKTITLTAPGQIFGQVNDTFYSNNGGAFSLTVAPVPEPEAWASMALGLGLAGWVARRRKGTLARS